MIKVKTAYTLTLLAIFLPASPHIMAQDKSDNYKLEQVLVMSRHGIRAPLVNYGDMLSSATPDKWPQWTTPGGYLTPKGAELEAMMGGYFREWLADTKLLKSKGCPVTTTVFTYANSLPRTIDTAQHFLFGAFPVVMCPLSTKKKLAKWTRYLIQSLPWI